MLTSSSTLCLSALCGVVFAPRAARGEVYTKEEFCRRSDAENPNGVDFGCEAYVTDPMKRNKMRRRAFNEVARARDALANVTAIAGERDGAKIRATLREGALGAFRRQGKRLAALAPDDTTAHALTDAYAEAIAAIERLDLAARRLELDSGPDALLSINDVLDQTNRRVAAFVDTAASVDDEQTTLNTR